MPQSDIKFLQEAIRAVHGCESKHVESVPVREVFRGQVAWNGTVEVFDLTGHEKAKRCYAWSYQDGKQAKALTVLHMPPVSSPQTAVQIAIATKCNLRKSK